MNISDLENVWKTTLAQIEVKLDSAAHYKTWFIPTELVAIDEDKAQIGVRNSYASDWLKKKHDTLIKETLAHVTGKKLDVVYVISKNISNKPLEKVSKQEMTQEAPLLRMNEGTNMDFSSILAECNLNPTCTFENFIVGPSNRLAHAACSAIVENPGLTYNPFFVYGDTGLGKTHITQAASYRILERNQAKKIYYTPSENFLNEMVQSIKTGKTKQFRLKYRSLDVLIIDDIQLISKWEQTQDELFNTFNALHSKSKQIILVSDRPPEKIHNLEARLKSRFQGGMVVKVEKPDYETRLAILDHKSKILGFTLPHEILEYIAQHIEENVRTLEGSMQQISLYNSIHSGDLSIAEVAKLLGTDQVSKRNTIKPSDVISKTAKNFGITSKDILSKSRKADIAFARQVVMYILREDLGYKLEQIAKTLNRKDHTTVMHAIDKVKTKIEMEEGFSDEITSIVNALKN